jgi:hypothetical protein
MAPAVLGLSGMSFHGSFHARRRASFHERIRAARPGFPVTAMPAEVAGHGPLPAAVRAEGGHRAGRSAPGRRYHPARRAALARCGPQPCAGPAQIMAPAGIRDLRRSPPHSCRRPTAIEASGRHPGGETWGAKTRPGLAATAGGSPTPRTPDGMTWPGSSAGTPTTPGRGPLPRRRRHQPYTDYVDGPLLFRSGG